MEALLCSTPSANARASSFAASSSFIGLGIQRVH
jgi:hypothetical protein